MTKELTPHQITDALRQCVHTDICHGCPYSDDRGIPREHCMREIMADAAVTIESLLCERK